ncbi:DUF3194 domain-containing protein [Methanosphaera sp. BMS]|uniref:DUF3194 domain-containing protein n=1 Tax=Methanosphaera sp. BMS TaxID=1789762 RepID=UPI000DC1CC54|nr:DUF3194 domain-containing protein [Methanosphaera sp. BMS]AWX33290.1 hypothetical protein AW729_09390 [Methanosphaera sp. BMS]
MKALTEEEIDQIIDLAYNTAEETILKNMNKKDFEDINIQINLDSLENGFDIDIDISLDSDMPLDDDLSEKAVENSLKAIDEYIEKRNASTDD